MKKIFVYGSLRKDMFNHAYLHNSKFIKFDSVDGYNMYSLSSYPCITKGKGVVFGEIYEVDDILFEYLKRMEENASYITTPCLTKTGIGVYLWVYDHEVKFLERVKSGDWVEFYKKERTR